MRMNRWLRTGKCLAILLTLLIMALKVIDATAAHDPATRDGQCGRRAGCLCWATRFDPSHRT